MGIDYRIDAGRNLTLVVWDGDVSQDEATAYLVRIAADPEWPPGRLHLTDLTSASAVFVPPPNADLLEVLVEGVEPFELAIVVSPHARWIADAFEATAAAVGTVVTVHTDIDDACAQLGVDASAASTTLGQMRAELQFGGR